MQWIIRQETSADFRAVLIYGHPDYYPRFGFQPAHDFGITTPDGSSFDALMAFELFPGALDGISGSFHESSAYEITPEEAAEFDRSFPPKQPASLLPITALTDRLPEDVGEAILKKNLPCINSLCRFSAREMLEWDGMDEEKFAAINRVLEELGRPKKTSSSLLPKKNSYRPQSSPGRSFDIISSGHSVVGTSYDRRTHDGVFPPD